MAPRVRCDNEVNARRRHGYVATTRLTLDSTTAQTMCATSLSASNKQNATSQKELQPFINIVHLSLILQWRHPNILFKMLDKITIVFKPVRFSNFCNRLIHKFQLIRNFLYTSLRNVCRGGFASFNFKQIR